MGYVAICHRCSRPTFIDPVAKKQHPGVSFGGAVKAISDAGVAALYDEARRAMAVNAYTAVVLACRKLLMHIAVSKGAGADQTFLHYVEWLLSNHYISVDAKEWVDHIRRKGNEANHEIVVMQEQDARELVVFSEMLLKTIFEFPAAIRAKGA